MRDTSLAAQYRDMLHSLRYYRDIGDRQKAKAVAELLQKFLREHPEFA